MSYVVKLTKSDQVNYVFAIVKTRSLCYAIWKFLSMEPLWAPLPLIYPFGSKVIESSVNRSVMTYKSWYIGAYVSIYREKDIIADTIYS